MRKYNLSRMIGSAASAGLIALSVCAAGYAAGASVFVSPDIEENGNTVQVETMAGRIEDVAVNVTEKTDSGVTTIRSKAAGAVADSGMIVDFSGLAELTPDADVGYLGTESTEYRSANAAHSYEAEGGSDVSVSKIYPQYEIEVSLTDEDDGKTEGDERRNTVNGDPAGQVSITGDVKQSPDDGVYDYTVKNILQQGSMTARTQKITITESVVAQDHHDMKYVRSALKKNEEQDVFGPRKMVTIPQNKDEVPKINDGYEYVYLGSDIFSRFYASYLFTTPGDADYQDAIFKNPITYEGKPLNFYLTVAPEAFGSLKIPRIYLKDRVIDSGERNFNYSAGDWYVNAWYDSIQQFTLSDANANIVTTYCADQNTGAVTGYSYVMKNIDDADYYSQAEAQMIRTVANNGYWGADSGYGSLDNLKQMMRKSGKFTEAEIDAVTPGVAITAMQYAIWTHSNIMDNRMFVNAYRARGTSSRPNQAAEKDKADLIFKLYFHLISLPPTVIDDDDKKTNNTIINEKNFIKDIRIKAIARADHANNRDAENDNDVYLTELSFSLKVTPDAAKDDLVLEVQDELGNVLATGRIAGGLKEGEIQLTREKGRYTFPDFEIVEGAKDLCFIMKGEQELDKDVYLYTSETKDGKSSQTMVGVAEGKRKVDVRLDILFDLDITDEVTSVEHYWRDEKRIDNPKGQPKTGDSSMLTLWGALLAIGCAGMMLARRKSA